MHCGLFFLVPNQRKAVSDGDYKRGEGCQLQPQWSSLARIDVPIRLSFVVSWSVVWLASSSQSDETELFKWRRVRRMLFPFPTRRCCCRISFLFPGCGLLKMYPCNFFYYVNRNTLVECCSLKKKVCNLKQKEHLLADSLGSSSFFYDDIVHN